MHTPILLIVICIHNAQILMFIDKFSEFSVLENVVVSFVYYRFLFMVDLTSLSVDVLKVTFILEMQMPRHKHVLFCKFFLTHTLLPLPFLLEGPHVDQSLSTNTGNSCELVDGPVSQRFVGKMVNDCDGNKGIATLLAEGEGQTISCKQLVLFVLLLCCLKQADRSISPHHEQILIDTHIFTVTATHVKHH